MSVAKDPQPFAWRRMPLDGRVLIEASAGTGKTFNIGLIYLRLLLEGERPLGVERILVTTFTDAAAQELRERLHARLVQAERVLVQKAAPVAGADDSVESYLAGFHGDAQRAALRRVQIARADFDRAPITTIHGLCLRVRRDFPLQSGAGFVVSAPSDESALLRECIEDFWRGRYLAGTADPREADAVLAKGLNELLRSVGGLFTRDARLVAADGVSEIDRLLQELKQDSNIAELRNLAQNRRCFAPRRTQLRKRLETIADILSCGSDVLPRLEEELDDAFDPAKIDDQQAPASPLHLNSLDLIIKLQRLRGLLPSGNFLRGGVLAAALAYCREQLPLRARRRDALTFSMLIDELHERLHAPGGKLADFLFDAFPAALIDEFQDTDRRQFAIFDRIYSMGTDHPRGLLVMIGDPKQAIFGFRGGDIAAYLRASAATTQRYSLAVNRRSSSALVGALNALYAHADGGFRDPRIRYRAVQAGPGADSEPYARAGVGVAAPLTIHRFRGGETSGPNNAPLKSATHLESMALEDCANRIVELLNDPTRTIGGRRVAPGDIAVLLAANKQIVSLRKLLVARRVPCVGSGRGSVFDTDVARDLELILYALLNVDDDRAVCGALTTRMLGANYADVIAWQDDAVAFEGELERFIAWRDLVAARGVLALIESLLELRGAIWLAQPDGERRITDLRHLGELLADEEGARHGLDGLYAWYAALRRGDEGEGGDAPESRQLRIESDLQRVKLLTVHAAKGLEFPIVFLPLAWRVSHREGSYAPTVLRFHDDDDNDCVDVGSAEFRAHRVRHFEEDLCERLRLLYVAMTRAKHALHVYWVDLAQPSLAEPDKVWKVSAFDVLIRAALQGIGEVPGEAALDALAAASTGIAIAEAWLADPINFAGAEERGPPRAAREPLPALRMPQWLHSFSSLVRNLQTTEHESSATDESDVPVLAGDETPDAPSHPQLLALQSLRGARFGDALHAILEHAAPGSVWPAQQQLVVKELGAQALRGSDAGNAPELVARLVDRVRGSELAAGLRLADLSADARVAEFEFQFPLQCVPVATLRALCVRHGYADVVPATLQADVLNGMLTGFVDLVFEHDGRFHVLDYKSNWLGARLSDYTGTALDAAMRMHHYELQALLYSVALHRYLRGRLDGYTPERQLGDSWYLFLRALGLETQAGVWRRRWPWQLIAALDDAFGGVTEAAA